jgi:hypothetical protein
LAVGSAALAAKTLPAIRTLRRLGTLTLSLKRLAAAHLRLSRIANPCCRVGLLPNVGLRPHGGLTGEARTIRSWVFRGSRAIDGLELTVVLDRLVYVCGLIGKRLRPGGWRALRQEAVLCAHARSNHRTDRPIGYAEIIATRHDRQVARHHAAATQVRRGHAPGGPSAASKASRRHSGDALTQTVVSEHVAQIRELRASMQRRDSVTKAADAVESHPSKVVPLTAPPRMEIVTRPDGHPAKGAESKPCAEAEAHALPKSKEGDVSGSPNRLISRVHRSGPPSP